MLRVEQIYTDSPLRNFTYLIHDTRGGPVVSIDPLEASPLIRRLEELQRGLTHIINTHEHSDHTAGNIGLVQRYNARVLGHEKAARKIPCFSEPLRAGEGLEWEDDRLLALDTPGHTFSHLSLLLEKNGTPAAVFSGDTMFNAGVGNCYNGGSPEILYESIAKYYNVLEDEVLLYPGHDYLINNLRFTLEYEPENTAASRLLAEYQDRIRDNPKNFMVTNLGLERDINTFLRLDSEKLRACLARHFSDLSSQASSKEIFLRLRALRDRW